MGLIDLINEPLVNQYHSIIKVCMLYADVLVRDVAESVCLSLWQTPRGEKSYCEETPTVGCLSGVRLSLEERLHQPVTEHAQYER